MGFFGTFWVWLNGELATYIGDNTARVAAALEPAIVVLATIYVMPMGGRDADEVVAAFERHKKFLRAEIAHRVNLKFAPDIRFRIDERFAEAERIDKLLRSPAVKRDLEDEGEDDE